FEPSERLAAEHVPVEVEDRLPTAAADVHDHAVVLEPGLARPPGHELEHPLRLVGGEFTDLAERIDVPLRQDEQVHGRLRRDIADRAESALPAPAVSRPRAPRAGAADDLADRGVDEPGIVIVRVAASGTIDEHRVLAAEPR